jgi:hypothetical protein
MSTTDDYTSDWRHTSALGNEGTDAAAFLPGQGTLLMYAPDSDTGEAWLHSDTPLDLRGWA